MKHFASDYEIDEAIAKYEGLPYLAKKCNCWDGYERVPGTKPCAPGSCRKCDEGCHKKSAKDKDESKKLHSQPFANPVPLSEEPGHTAGGESIEKALEKAPSAVGTGKEAGRYNSFIDVVPDGEEIGRGIGQGIVDEAIDQFGDFVGIDNISNESQANALKDALQAGQTFKAFSSAHKVEKDGDKFYVTEEGEGNVAGPFDSQEEAYSRANELNDLENLESKKSAQGDKPSPHAAKAVFDALCEGDEDSAINLLGHTDCPEGCEVHAEGKCNHQYMSAGRTRVRYLVGSQAFKSADKGTKDLETTDRESV